MDSLLNNDIVVSSQLEVGLLRLMKTIIRKRSIDKSGYNENERLSSIHPELFELCKTMLYSRLTPSVLKDETHICFLISKRLGKSSIGIQASLRFKNLIVKINKQGIITDAWPILYLLLTIAEKRACYNIQSGFNSSLNSLLHKNISQPGLPSLNFSENVKSAISPPVYSLVQDPSRNLSPIMNQQQNYVSEELLVRDLIYIFQGIDGQYVKFDPKTNAPVFIPNVMISRTSHDLVLKLFECGFLFKKILTHIQNRPLVSPHGLVSQSFCSYLHTTVSDYYRLLAVLDSHIFSCDKQISPESNSPQKLTLRQLLIWTFEPLLNLRLLANLIDATQNQHGGAFLSAIHNFINHGDPSVQDYINLILKKVSRPFYQIIQHWVYEGNLLDPHQEFFVLCNNDVPEEKLWRSKYKMAKEMIPTFFDPALARKIFLIGKSLNYIRYSCQVPDWRWKLEGDVIPGQSSSATILEYGHLSTQRQSIDYAYEKTRSKLMDLLFTKYQLMDHFAALKRYLLLGQGDFIQHLMDSLVKDLSKPASTLHRHNLTAILESAIRSSNAQYEEPTILNRLDVQILEVSPGDKGWEVFSLNYHVDSPINTIFTPFTMTQYLKLFNFLWRLKRVEHALSTMWRRHMLASRSLTSYPKIKADLHTCHIITAEMIHFINQYQYFLLFEVIECSWEKLFSQLQKREGGLDRLIEAHTQYLNKITAKGLLSNVRDDEKTKVLLNLLDLILKYQDVHRSLIDHGLTRLAMQRQNNSNILESHDVDHSFMQLIENPATDSLDSIRDKLSRIANEFQKEVRNLISFLYNHSELDMRSLCFRLNFNDVYSSPINLRKYNSI